MYNVYHGSWRDFTTAVGVFSIRVLFAALTRHTRWSWVNNWQMLSRTLVRGRVIGELFEGNCWRGNVCGETFCSLRSHGTRLLLTQQSKPCLVMGRAKVERFVFATNGTIERFDNLVRQELMNVWRDSILFASLTRHTLRLWALTRPSAQQTVPCHGKSGCLRLRSN